MTVDNNESLSRISFSFGYIWTQMDVRTSTQFESYKIYRSLEIFYLPGRTSWLESLQVQHKAAPVPPLVATPEQLQAFEAKNPSNPPLVVPMPPAVVYPPLEPQELRP